MAAALHHVEVIDHVAGVCQRTDDGIVRIIDEQHDVRKLQGCVPADRLTRRDPLEHGPLGRPYQRRAVRRVVILLQVDLADYSAADSPVALHALQIDHAVRILFENAFFLIFEHRLVDLLDVLLRVPVFKLGLRQDQTKRGWMLPYELLHALPILGLGCELIARHHGPCLIITLGWK